MSKFYFFLWLRWAFRVSVCSVLLAAFLSTLITIYLYISQSLPALSNEVVNALWQLFTFWFPITWSITLLFALFRSLKYIFNVAISGYELKLNSCDGEEQLEVIGYGDLVHVWRKWFMLMIWLVGAQMIISVAFTSMFSSYNGIFDWFDIYFLFVYILLAGYISFILLGGRCKKVKVVKC